LTKRFIGGAGRRVSDRARRWVFGTPGTCR